MAKKYLISLLTIMLALTIALMARSDESQANQPSDQSVTGADPSLTSPRLAESVAPALKGAASRAVVWDNGMDYVGLLTAQQESTPPPAGLDSEPADDFIFEVDQIVNDVHWIGGYWAGPPDDGNFDWTIRFYADDGTGTKPGALIATYPFANAAVNETLISGYFYSYSVDLPSPLTFAAGTKYWISIQGQGDTAPQSGWAYHEEPSIILHEAVIRSLYFGLPDWTNTSAALGIAVDMCFQLTFEERCQWNDGDPYKMHFPQLPDELGWDVDATYRPGQPMVLADDFGCTQSGPILDIHFWGSWKGDNVGQIVSFFVSIAENIPADPPSMPYSRPGRTLWEREIVDFDVEELDPPSMEGWYDPATGEVIYDDHGHYFQYNICFDESDPDLFYQTEGDIYWLSISAIVIDPAATLWGWKSTQDHWEDDACWAFWGDLAWKDIWEPSREPLENGFYIAIDPYGTFITGGGSDYYGKGWYYYEDTEWWNIWYYDHPFDSSRKKFGFIVFDLFPVETSMPMYFELAVNWSTDWWSIEQPPADSFPPIPPVDEATYIGRLPLFATEYYEGSVGPLYYEIPPYYNPEWVSVDVRGYNFTIPGGIIQHDCRGSLDLAFVITGETADSGACCYDPTGGPNHSACIYTTENDCGQVYNGIYEGDGVQCEGVEACCLPGGACVMADALCCVNELSGQPQGAGSVCSATEACCFGDGSCQMLDPLCCIVEGGQPQGPGTACGGTMACCMPDSSCQMADSICCIALGGTPQGTGTDCTGTIACCFQDGTCKTVSPVCCDDLGGTPSPFGAPACLGDGNGNSIDDACEVPEDLKWRQSPDLDPTGLDVGATCPGLFGECLVLADDFLCQQAGAITEIVVYGSWLYEEYPGGDPGNVSFILSIHSDIPAGVDQPWSHPGGPLWMQEFHPGQFEFEPYATDIEEGYYDPFGHWYEPYTDFICWKYIFPIPNDQFIQEGSESEPVVYWLDVQAFPQYESYFGWKTSTDHWNDDAVWSPGFEPVDPVSWMELRYIPPHPWTGESIDLAFEIYGGACDCRPGDANGDTTFNVGDAVYIVSYIFKGGPPPTPYRICSGDADCNCTVNIADAVYMITYIFKGGPPPCDCPTWLSICGPPLRE